MPSFRSFRSLSPRARSEFRTGILFLSPWIFGFLAFTLLPMLFVLTITLWALSSLVIGNFRASSGFDVKLVNGIASLALILLAIYLVITAILKLRKEKQLTPVESV